MSETNIENTEGYKQSKYSLADYLCWVASIALLAFFFYLYLIGR